MVRNSLVKTWLIGLVLAIGCLGSASADNFPSRPITLVVPLSVGGSTDVIGRLMAEGMRKALNQTIIVENISGAGGTIGVGHVVHAPPDGYTMLIGQWGTNVATGAIYNLNFDLLKDLDCRAYRHAAVPDCGP